MSSQPAQSDRRSELLGVKLAALVRDHLGGEVDVVAVPFSPGAGLRVGASVWVLIDDGAGDRLGAALATLVRQGGDDLSVIAADTESAGVIARRAAAFSVTVDVYVADGRSLRPVAPAPFRPPLAVPEHHLELRDLIVDGGAEPIEEWGVLAGEVRGLEVCRVVDDPATGATRLEVGTGAHDREAFAMIHGDTPTVESLRRIVDVVDQHRTADADPHPLNRLGQSRLLRDRLIQEPSKVGLASLLPAAPPVPRANLKDPVPAVAIGERPAGDRAVVVCSVGVDLELVPFAADARSATDPNAALMIVTPPRDQLGINTDLAELLIEPAELVAFS